MENANDNQIYQFLRLSQAFIRTMILYNSAGYESTYNSSVVRGISFLMIRNRLLISRLLVLWVQNFQNK